MTKEGLFEKRVAGIEPFSMLDFGENLCGILFYNRMQLSMPDIVTMRIWPEDLRKVSQLKM